MKKTIERIKETKNVFFEKINQIDKPQPDSSGKKERGFNNIRNEKGEVTMDITEIQEIMRPLQATMCQ